MYIRKKLKLNWECYNEAQHIPKDIVYKILWEVYGRPYARGIASMILSGPYCGALWLYIGFDQWLSMNVCHMEFLKIHPKIQALLLGHRQTDRWTDRDNLHVKHPFLIVKNA
jgi:hypothetical protein